MVLAENRAEESYERLKSFLILFVIGVVVIKGLMSSSLMGGNRYNGQGYSLIVPEGWKLAQELSSEEKYGETEVSSFIPDRVYLQGEKPDAVISIMAQRMQQAWWVEDEWGLIVKMTQARPNTRFLDKGEIKIDDVISKWLIFHDKITNMLVLQFYITTDNQMFIKIEYSAGSRIFEQRRPEFEALKDSIKIKQFGL